VSSVTKPVSGATRRSRAQAPERPEGYLFCPEDRYWFRPAYTDGRCPLCGEVAPGAAPAEPLWRRLGTSWYGLAGLAVESLDMLALVLFMYFRR
jgi:hypothetical protein